MDPDSTTDHPAWPTLLVAAGVGAAWLALTWFHASLPFALALALGATASALHLSLQHETIHDHPASRRLLAVALAWPPLNLWLPYSIYREEHLRHHDDDALTLPHRDPESKYVARAEWAIAGRARRALLAVDATLLGRLTLGPALALASFVRAEANALVAGARGRQRIWLAHGFGCAAVLGWAVGVCGMPILDYALIWTYGGLSLTLLRSYAEHVAAEDPARRTAVVEAEAPLGFVFLNNNLHAVHHARPELPWFALPAAWRGERDALLARNGGLAYRGYREVARRFLLRPMDSPAHPFA